MSEAAFERLGHPSPSRRACAAVCSITTPQAPYYGVIHE